MCGYVDNGYLLVDYKVKEATESSETLTPDSNGVTMHGVNGSEPGTPPNVHVEPRKQASPPDSGGEGESSHRSICSNEERMIY